MAVYLYKFTDPVVKKHGEKGSNHVTLQRLLHMVSGEMRPSTYALLYLDLT